jgi:hypothetical protein
VNQTIAKSDDSTGVRDPLSHAGLKLDGPAQRFSDDFKLTFYRRPQQGICTVIRVRLPRDEPIE